MNLRFEFARADDGRWRAWAPDFGTQEFADTPEAAMHALETTTLLAIAERRAAGEPVTRR